MALQGPTGGPDPVEQFIDPDLKQFIDPDLKQFIDPDLKQFIDPDLIEDTCFRVFVPLFGLTCPSSPTVPEPVIKVPPRNQVNRSGSSLVFLCEVFAFPMALVEWRKDGRDVVLPGDDPHISVQSRGGPLRFELSSWLQIEGAEPGDSGTYRCTARNNLGSVSASAVLGVLGEDELSSYLSRSASEMKQLMDDYDQDYL
ncbi:PREDICTED: kazal-type serine protease inhibitor domain-containing protein 1-like [Cyprinodon variegatus]|uniref:kazal-type serine protease inhibitor domain-containing protein 1-like n=1 Tax=Cyprinodon variegatus TaxID=28743 RepID=UPI00074282C6|nr:PREDICTED: kazal-type serine protease inhibitor domain-containing protein 1-like [Cyprinodon variegatus]